MNPTLMELYPSAHITPERGNSNTAAMLCGLFVTGSIIYALWKVVG